MGEMAFLASAGLLAALAIGIGLWGWRRLSRKASVETAPRAAAAALRASAPHVASSDADMAGESPRASPTRRTMGGSGGAATAEPVTSPPEPLGAANLAQAADEDGTPEPTDVLQEPLPPAQSCIPVQPSSPPAMEEPIAPAVPVSGSAGAGADRAEPDLLAPNVDEKAPETDSQSAVAAPDSAPTSGPDAAVDQVAVADQDSPALVLPAQPPELLAPDPPPLEDAAALAVPEPGGGETEPAEQVPLPSPPDGEPAPGAGGQVAVVAGGAIAPCEDAGAEKDGSAPVLTPRSTVEAPHDAGLASADSTGDPPEEGVASQPDTGPEEPAPEAEAESDTARLPTAAGEEDPAQSAAPAEPNSGSEPAPQPALEPPAGRAPRPKQPAVHRDRRGKRRAVEAAAPPESVAGVSGQSIRPPAEARLRLSLHPIRRTARLSVILTRPDGFPARVTVQEAGSQVIEAYDDQRYDDLDLPWTSELLDGEFRLASADGFQWLRSARQVHLFVQDPNEPELISASAARTGIAHALICRSGDVEAVRLAAASTGSSELQTHEHWQGIPGGWIVLSGYTPMHAAATPLPAGLRTLDPGEGLEIGFDGGLALRGRVYAAGYPPRILILPAPGAASVTIGSQPAALSADGAWTAPGWDAPGQHIVDVVPGPSASYEIAADPWLSGGWDFWDAHPERFGDGVGEPWSRARICGALVRGPADEMVFAAETQPTLIALGARSGAMPLRRRGDAAVSVGLMAQPPAFLLAATGLRRSQGRVVWLGLAPAQKLSRQHDAEWVTIVRSAAARRLPLVQADSLGEDSWRKAKERARRLRNRRPLT